MFRRLTATLDVPAPPSEVWRLLADIESYPDWLPALRSAELLAREGDLAVTRLEGPAGQLVTEVLLTQAEQIEFSEVGKLRSGWVVRLSLTRQGTGARLRIEATAPTRFTLSLTNYGGRQELRLAVAALARRLGAEDGEPRDATPAAQADRQLILELRRRKGGLELWVAGNTVALPPGGRE